jgi:hypothetical protein
MAGVSGTDAPQDRGPSRGALPCAFGSGHRHLSRGNQPPRALQWMGPLLQQVDGRGSLEVELDCAELPAKRKGTGPHGEHLSSIVPVESLLGLRNRNKMRRTHMWFLLSTLQKSYAVIPAGTGLVLPFGAGPTATSSPVPGRLHPRCGRTGLDVEDRAHPGRSADEHERLSRSRGGGRRGRHDRALAVSPRARTPRRPPRRPRGPAVSGGCVPGRRP